jgi:general nucleoside transport system ATP-binding protein
LASDPNAPRVLRLAGIGKRFGPLVANDAIDLELRRGEILALLGENGAGKTTLMNILFGHYVADAGTIEVARPEGTLASLAPGSPQAALDAGIGMVHQHFALAESLSVLENVVLGTRPLFSARLELAAARAKLVALMAESGLDVPPDRQVSRLSVGEKQRLEILKVLYRGARILVLDEPTAVLTPQEVEGLFAVLRRLTAKGLSIIFISHKLNEVLAIADRIAVLRAGAKVADRAAAGADRAMLAELMVGRAVAQSRRTPRAPGPALLVLDRVSVTDQHGRAGLAEASLSVHAGEIVGIAGVSGNGQGALAGVIAGTMAGQGTITVAGEALNASPRASIQAGIGRIPEDRHDEGIVGALTIAENLALETLHGAPVARGARVARNGFLKFKPMRERAETAIRDYDVRCPGPDAPIRLLSGGNIQKVILARVFERNPRVVLANQPTRGLDVGATAEVHRRLLEARARGVAIVLISEDLDELLALSDRVAVMARGRLSEARAVESVTREQLGLMMAGHHAQAAGDAEVA